MDFNGFFMNVDGCWWVSVTMGGFMMDYVVVGGVVDLLPSRSVGRPRRGGA